MRKKKNLVFIVVLIIGILSIFSFKNYAIKVKDKHCLVTQISSRVFDLNEFDLKVDSVLNIYDFKVVNQNSGKTIFENGKRRKGIDNDYGHCIFELYYKDKMIYEFGHFKFNNWHTNQYELSISILNNEMKPNLEIIGPDDNKADLYFKKID